jgi:peptidoglycan-associated lipoprotein
MKNLIIMMFVTFLLAACVAERPPAPADSAMAPVETPASANKGPVLGSPVMGEVSVGGLTESARVAAQQGLKDKSVYFDFDTFIVKPEYRELLQQHADIMKAHRGDSVTLEGNADERGSPEYNLAIGQKRSHAVKVQLSLLGVDASRIHETSFGEEKPRATCHDESCWKQNRRVDFVYLAN